MADVPLPTLGYKRLYGDRDKAVDEASVANASAVPLLDSLGFAVERENFIGKAVNDHMEDIGYSVFPDENGSHWIYGSRLPEKEKPIVDLEYNHVDDELNYDYPAGSMVNAVSAAHAATIRAEIDEERAELFAISANATGAIGTFFGAVTAPHTMIGAGIATTRIGLAMAVEGGLEIGNEAMLHSQQKLRTVEQSAWSAFLVTSTVGVLGKSAQLYRNANPKMPKDLLDEINSGSYPVGSNLDSAGAARVVDKDAITREEDALISRFGLADTFSIGQMSHLVKSASNTVRDIAQRIADNPFFTKAHAEGKTRGVTVESLHEAAMGRVVIATEAAAAIQKTSGLGVKQFDDEVGIAMSSGDKHSNPQVQQAAEKYRKDVIEPIREAAERVGLLESDEVLKARVKELTDDVERMVAEGAGKGSTQAKQALELERAKIVSAGEKEGLKLQKAIEKAEAALVKSRTPGKDGAARTAPPSMIAKHNEAKSALTAHKKSIEDATKGQRDALAALKKQKAALAAARKESREAQAKLDEGTQFAESYFPRVYDRNKIFDKWDLLTEMLTTKFKTNKITSHMEEGEIKEMVLDTMLNMVSGRSQVASVKGGVPTALRARVLAIMDDQLEPFLEKGASNVLIRHAQGMQPYIMMREAFDNRTMDEMFSVIDDEYKVLIARESKEGVADPARVEALIKAKALDKERLEVIRDRLMHQIQRSIRPRGAVEKVLQAAKLWNLTTMLGGIVLSSLPDLARPISHYGLGSFSVGVAKTVGQYLQGKGGISSIQVKRTGAALQRTLNDRAMQLSDSLAPDSKWMQKGHKMWSSYSGFNVYTDIMESVAAHAAMDYTIRQAQKVAAGGALSGSARKQFARMGITEDDLKAIDIETNATRGGQDATLKFMNTMQWQDVDLARRIEAGIGSDVRRTIIRLGAAEKPAFMDETMASFLFQFQSFAMGAQNKILVAGFQNMNLHTAEGLIAMMALGYGVGATKGWIRGDDPSEWTNEQKFAEGMDRSGITGALRTPFNLLRYALAATGVTDGIPSRYVGQELSRLIPIPTLSVLGTVGLAGKAAIDGDHAKAATLMSRSLPFVNNTWHVREVLTKMGDL